MVLRPWATPFLGENGVALSNLSIDFLAVEAAPLGGIGSESPLDTMTGWWFGTCFISPYIYIIIIIVIIGNIIIPTDELHHFSEG